MSKKPCILYKTSAYVMTIDMDYAKVLLVLSNSPIIDLFCKNVYNICIKPSNCKILIGGETLV